MANANEISRLHGALLLRCSLQSLLSFLCTVDELEKLRKLRLLAGSEALKVPLRKSALRQLRLKSEERTRGRRLGLRRSAGRSRHCRDRPPPALVPRPRDHGRAGRADIRGGQHLSGYVRTESVSAEFSTAASEPWLRLENFLSKPRSPVRKPDVIR